MVFVVDCEIQFSIKGMFAFEFLIRISIVNFIFVLNNSCVVVSFLYRDNCGLKCSNKLSDTMNEFTIEKLFVEY